MVPMKFDLTWLVDEVFGPRREDVFAVLTDRPNTPSDDNLALQARREMAKD